MLAHAPRRVSVHGSARADGIDLVARAIGPRGPRVTRILAKAVGDGCGGDGENDSPRRGRVGGRNAEDKTADQADEENEDTRRQNEINRLRYAELSASYLRDPFARLQVHRSSIHGGGLFAAANNVFEKDEMIVEYIGQSVRQAVADRREVQYEVEGVGSCYLFRVDKEGILDATRRGGMARFINHSCEPNAYAKIIETIETKKILVSKRVMITKTPEDMEVSPVDNDILAASSVQPNGADHDSSVPMLENEVIGGKNTTDGESSEDEVEEEDEEDVDDGLTRSVEILEEVEVEERAKHIIIFAARDILGGEEITYDYKFPLEEKKLRCYCGAPTCLGSMN